MAERLSAWRARIVTGITRTVAVICAPLALAIGYDATRMHSPALSVAFLVFSIGAIACALVPCHYRLRAWWTVLNFTWLLWMVAAFAGLHAGTGAAVLLIAVLAAVVLGKTQAVLALGLVSGGQALIGCLSLAKIIPRPMPEISDTGVPSTLLRESLTVAALGAVALVTITYLLRELMHTLLETERSIVSLWEEMAARHKAEEELVRAQKLELLARLAGGVVHDINNNLTVALSGAEFLELHQAADNRSHRLAISVREACENASALSRQLLTLGRNQQLSTPRTIDVAMLLPRLERLLRASVGGKIQLEISVAPELPPVHVDPQELEQVLLNLALNARDALEAGGKIAICVECDAVALDYQMVSSEQPVTPAVRFHVTDDGRGIAPEALPHLFEPFFTTKGPEHGTGLGLFVARRFVDTAGGKLGVRSEPGRGSTFTLELPTAPDGLRSSRGLSTSYAEVPQQGA